MRISDGFGTVVRVLDHAIFAPGRDAYNSGAWAVCDATAERDPLGGAPFRRSDPASVAVSAATRAASQEAP